MGIWVRSGKNWNKIAFWNLKLYIWNCLKCDVAKERRGKFSPERIHLVPQMILVIWRKMSIWDQFTFDNGVCESKSIKYWGHPFVKHKPASHNLRQSFSYILLLTVHVHQWLKLQWSISNVNWEIKLKYDEKKPGHHNTNNKAVNWHHIKMVM